MGMASKGITFTKQDRKQTLDLSPGPGDYNVDTSSLGSIRYFKASSAIQGTSKRLNNFTGVDHSPGPG
jgi:hypothetical protein